MPVLYNKQTQRDEFVPEEMVAEARKSGAFASGPNDRAIVTTPEGRVVPVDPALLESAGTAGEFAAATEGQVAGAERQAFIEDEYGGAAGALKTGLEQALDTASLGIYGAIGRNVDPDFAQRRRDELDVHPVAGVAGTIAGAAVPALLSGGSGALAAGARATPVGALSAGGRAIGGKLGLAAEGLGLGAGSGVQRLALENDPITLDHALSTIGTSAIIGAGLGVAIPGALGVAGMGLGQAKKIADKASARAAAGAGKPPVTVDADLQVMDRAGLRAEAATETTRLEGVAAVERANVADEIAAFRADQKVARPWIAVEGFKNKPQVAPSRGVPSYESLAGGEGVTRQVPLKDIRDRLISLDGEVAGRAEPIRRAIDRGAELPPVDVNVLPNGQLFVADGRNRLRAFAEKGVKKVPVRFTAGVEGAELGAVQLFPPKLRAPARRVSRQLIQRGDDEFILETVEAPFRATSADDAFDPKMRFIPDVDGTGATTWVRLIRSKNGKPEMMDGAPFKIGEAQLIHEGDKLYPRNVEVQPRYQRRGLASEMYKLAEKRTGRRIIPSETQTAQGAKLSQAYRARRSPQSRPANPVTSSAEPKVPAALAREFREIGRLTIEADRYLDRLLRNPRRLAQRPWNAEAALQQQEHALERLSSAAPELRARLAADTGSSGAREAALDSVDALLARTRELQARLKLTTPKSHGGDWKPASPRLDSIQAADDLLTTPARQRGLLERAATGYAAAAVTGLAPGGALGAAAAYTAPHVARKVADLVFGRMSKAGATSAQRTAGAVDRLLGSARTVGRRARPAALPLAIKALTGGREKKAPKSGPKAPKSAPTRRPDPPLVQAYLAVEKDLRSLIAMGTAGVAVVRPEVRQAFGAALVGVGMVSPILADRMETHWVRQIEFLVSKLPRRPELGMQIGEDLWRPSAMEIRTFARYKAAIDDIGAVEERVADGTLSPEDAEAYRAVYPDRLADFTRQIVERLPELRGRLSQPQLISLSVLTGLPIHPALEPQVLTILQASHEMEEGTEGGTQAPAPQPQFGSVKAEPYTPAQERAAR